MRLAWLLLSLRVSTLFNGGAAASPRERRPGRPDSYYIPYDEEEEVDPNIYPPSRTNTLGNPQPMAPRGHGRAKRRRSGSIPGQQHPPQAQVNPPASYGGAAQRTSGTETSPKQRRQNPTETVGQSQWLGNPQSGPGNIGRQHRSHHTGSMAPASQPSLTRQGSNLDSPMGRFSPMAHSAPMSQTAPTPQQNLGPLQSSLAAQVVPGFVLPQPLGQTFIPDVREFAGSAGLPLLKRHLGILSVVHKQGYLTPRYRISDPTVLVKPHGYLEALYRWTFFGVSSKGRGPGIQADVFPHMYYEIGREFLESLYGRFYRNGKIVTDTVYDGTERVFQALSYDEIEELRVAAFGYDENFENLLDWTQLLDLIYRAAERMSVRLNWNLLNSYAYPILTEDGSDGRELLRQWRDMIREAHHILRTHVFLQAQAHQTFNTLQLPQPPQPPQPPQSAQQHQPYYPPHHQQ